VHWNIPDGDTVPAHHHPQEQFGYIIRGTLELTVDGETFRVEEGDSYVIPPNAVHEFRALGQVEAIDVFAPPRDLSTAGAQPR
jgi:quercetin dioxygenase-like cupin family protein